MNKIFTTGVTSICTSSLKADNKLRSCARHGLGYFHSHNHVASQGAHCNGTAEVEWQLNPDGRFYMDDNCFGMTDDEEVSLIGRIDREGKVVKSFTLK